MSETLSKPYEVISPGEHAAIVCAHKSVSYDAVLRILKSDDARWNTAASSGSREYQQCSAAPCRCHGKVWSEYAHYLYLKHV